MELRGLETCQLVCHQDSPSSTVSKIDARVVEAAGHWLCLRWRIEGAAHIIVPPLAGRGRADGLWQNTCFEMFLRTPGSDAYVEINLSPSERWAIYDFTGYRDGMAPRPAPRDAACAYRPGRAFAIFDAAVPLAALPPLPWQIGLAAVIEEQGGTKSYWALAHPPGKPDFHHPACFDATLPAPIHP